MGCASSKQARRDRIPVTPLPRSHSLPVPVHDPAEKKVEPYHIVALTSSTLGNLALDSSDPKPDPPNSILKKDEKEGDGKDSELIIPTKIDETHRDRLMDLRPTRLHLEFSKEVSAAKTWSSMMEEKISKMPKTPTETPPGEPETINTWEMMEGLEDTSPIRCFSFHAFSNTRTSETWDPIAEPDSPKPLWIQTPAPDAIIAEFDPEIISNFRKALEQLSPPNTCHLRSPEGEKMGSVQDRIRAFQDRIDERRAKKGQKQLPPPTPPPTWSSPAQSQWPPRGEARVVVYFTGLRGVRKTYEDCCRARLILKGLGVRVDERDVSIHRGFREELLELLGPVFGGLPQVFVNGTYVGGAEEVRRMHDSGELDKLSEGCEKVEEGGGIACEGCGDVRFVPCEACSGSCKVFVEEEDEDGFHQEGFVRCLDCNENGLVQCPLCFS
ncbi:hypothetical protein ACLOJK_029002 [Asimina triloba]